MHHPSLPFSQLGRAEWANLGKAALTGVSSLSLGYFLWQIVVSDHLGNDFGQFQRAATFLLTRDNPYLHSTATDIPFIYPLWADLPYLWTGFFSASVALSLWTGVALAVMVGVVFCALQVVDLPLPWWTWTSAVLFGLVMMSNGIIVSQPTIVIALAYFLGLWLLMRRKPFLAGTVSFVFLLMKPQLTLLIALVLIVWFLMGNRRFVWGAVLSVACTSLITLSFIPSWPFDYLATFNVQHTGAGSQWYTATLLDWLHYSFGIENIPAYSIYACWVLAGLLSIGWFFIQARRGYGNVFSLAVVTTAISFAITPYCRDYDYPLLILPMAYVFKDVLYFEKNRVVQLISLGLLLFCPLYYLRGGVMYEFFVLNALIALLTIWRCGVGIGRR